MFTQPPATQVQTRLSVTRRSDSFCNGVRVAMVELWAGDLEQVRWLLAELGYEREAAAPAPDAIALRIAGARFVLRRSESTPSHGRIGDVHLVADDLDAIAARAAAAGAVVTRSTDRLDLDLLGDGTITHAITRGRSRALSRGMIDHVTYCLPWGRLQPVARAYREVFAMELVPNDDYAEVGDRASGMTSVVLRGGDFTVVLTEPRGADANGQTQRFVHAHGGAGIQHVAIACDDLVATAAALRARGVEFLSVPAEHFDHARDRLRDRDLPWETLRRLGVLVDVDATGMLFQVFTRPVGGPSGCFVELVERAGATGFGARNVTALFAAVEAGLRNEVS